MSLLFTYSLRNLGIRRVTTALTAGGMALVVFVYAAVLMLDAGLQATLSATGDDTNVIFVRRAAEVEMQSILDRQQASIITSVPEVVVGADSHPVASKEVVVMVALPGKSAGRIRSIVARGVGPSVHEVRPQVRITAGRMFRSGSNEVVVGSRLGGFDVGSTISFAQRDWHVVGRFDASGSGFDSEIWGDTEQFMQAFRRNAYSSVVVRLADSSAFAALKARLESDPRLTVEAKRERLFYEEQSRMLSGLIRVLGLILSVLFSLGAIIGAIITMYSAVASRRREIGALRALGFRRSTIVFTFLGESMLIGVAGWVAGLLLASLLINVQITTLNWTSFTELAFRFFLTPAIILQSLVFALAMGFLGGFLPALRAAHLKIVDALRSV